MFSAESTRLRSQVSPINTIIDDQSNSVFLRRPHVGVDTVIRDVRFVTPASGTAGVGFGQEHVFEIGKQATIFTKCWLKAAYNPIPLRNNATYVRFQDHIGYAQIKEVTTSYGSTPLFRWRAPWFHVRISKYLCRDKREIMDELIQSNRSSAQRSQLTQSGFNSYTPLLLPHSFTPGQCMRLVALSQKYTINVSIWEVEKLLQTDGTINDYSTDDIKNGVRFSLLVDFYHLRDQVGSHLVAETLSDKGVTHMVFEPKFQEFQIQNSTPNFVFEFPLRTSGVIKTLYFYLVPQQCLNVNGNCNFFMVSNNPQPPILGPNGVVPYDPIGNIGINANGVPVTRQEVTDYQILKYLMMFENHTAPAGENIFFLTASFNTEAENANYGNIVLANLDDPKFNIQFGATGTGIDPFTGKAQTLILQLIYVHYNFLQMQDHELNVVFAT